MTRDGTFRDKYRTGNTPLTGSVLYQLVLPDNLHFIAEVLDALSSMTLEENWEQTGIVTIEQALDAAVTMIRNFEPIQDGSMAVGDIIAGAWAAIPTGFLACDGAQYTQSQYPALYAAIDPVFKNTVNQTFVVPDLRGRSIIGVGQGSGLSNRAINQAVGSETHTLDVNEMPSHRHWRNPNATNERVLNDDSTGTGAYAQTGTRTGSVWNATDFEGGGKAHNNMQPSRALRYAIKAE